MNKKFLYLDIDGVLLGKDDPESPEVVLARHAVEFLKFCLDNFTPFWLTTNCRDGDPGGIVNTFKRYAVKGEMELIARIKPTCWDVFKTEAIDLKSDFYWVEDQLLGYEMDTLKNNRVLGRWIQIDTRKNPDDLKRAISILKNKLGRNA